MLVLRNENVGNFQNGCKGERYGLAHSVGCYCCTCIHGFSYDLHYRTTFRLTFLYNLKLTPLSEPTEQIINNTMSKKVNKAIKDVDPKEAKTLIELAIKVLKDLFK